MRPEPGPWHEWARAQLDDVRASGRWRHNRTFDAAGPRGVLEGRVVTSYASNDYLGLSVHPAVRAAACAAAERWGTGSTASRLIVGSRPVHDELEAAIAAWKHTDRALVFSSGYAANAGVLTTFGGHDVTVFSDELNHASIIDGCRLSRSAIAVFRHNDVEHLVGLMDETPGRKIVVADAVFSMDGDEAPVAELVAACERVGALLVLDEAHAVLGPELPTHAGVDVVRVGTLSKTLGALGGWAAGSGPMIDLLINRARSYIFTTALSPPDAAAAVAALGILRSVEGNDLIVHLRGLIDRVRPGHPSPVIPVVLGDEEDALRAAAALLGEGILVPAIRPPTVPVGTSRLRIALSAAHTTAQVDELVGALRRSAVW